MQTAIRPQHRLSAGRFRRIDASNSQALRSSRHIVHGLKENVAQLAPIDSISSITVQPINHTIPNAPGKKASVAIYNHLAKKYGGNLTTEAASEGLKLYGEYVAEAKEQPGSHPNIDILFDVIDKDVQLTIEVASQ